MIGLVASSSWGEFSKYGTTRVRPCSSRHMFQAVQRTVVRKTKQKHNLDTAPGQQPVLLTIYVHKHDAWHNRRDETQDLKAFGTTFRGPL